MFVEFVVLALAACVILACSLGRAVAVRGRAVGAQVPFTTVDPPLGRPSIVAATAGPIDDLPLVAPAGAGYGTAGRLLVLAA
ncbi:hypothetical protein [Kineosporia mesophila]|nr:hypothetical protein [Kineosporia mesophila]MCD5349540.1 hypothetical protein [Kineosporia mesophila]